MLSNVLAADSPDRAMVFPCSSLQWIRLVNNCKDKFRTQQWWPTILSRNSRFRNRAENLSNLPQHSDIHRMRKGKRVAKLQRELPKRGHGKNIIRERQRSSSELLQPELFHTHDRRESFPGDKSSGATPPGPTAAVHRSLLCFFQQRAYLQTAPWPHTAPGGLVFTHDSLLCPKPGKRDSLPRPPRRAPAAGSRPRSGHS